MSELTEIVAPYRSDEDCRLNSLHSRLREAKEMINREREEHTDRQEIGTEITRLLVDLGYTIKTVKNTNYVDSHKLGILTRENEGLVDMLVGKRNQYGDSHVFYLNVKQDKLKQLEKDILRCYSFGSGYSKKGLIKRLAEPIVAVGSSIGCVLLDGVVGDMGAITIIASLIMYSNPINEGEFAYAPEFLNQLSNRRLKKQDIKTGTDALLAALYLPEQNDRE